MGQRKIIHVDLDAFFCAVEEIQNPNLKNKSFAVGGRPGERGVVASCSYAARLFGVRSAMPMSRAIKLCPELIIIQPHHNLYSEYSNQVMSLLHRFTPLVEQISIDEAFLDISDIPKSPVEIAKQIQENILTELKLSCSIGVASNKLVAKIATDIGKTTSRSNKSPNALLVVPPGLEADFLNSLPTEALWGVGPKTAAQLADLGINTIGDIARWPEADFVKRFGKMGVELITRSRGIDNRPVVTHHEIKSISQEITFGNDLEDCELLERSLFNLAENIGRRLRKAQLKGYTIKIKIRWANFLTITRQITLNQAIDQDQEIFHIAWMLFQKAWQLRQPVRLIGIALGNFMISSQQLGFWDANMDRGNRLQETIDKIRDRFGEQIIRYGRDIDENNI
jgi:DNA polymerase-4